MEVAEKASIHNPVGLYHNAQSNQYLGALDSIQADAFLRLGFVLVKEGSQAANMSQDDIDKLGSKRKDS